MADTEQSFVENNEEQNFSMQDQHHLTSDEFDQQNLSGSVPEDYHYTGNDTDNQNLGINDQGFALNETENNYGALSEQTFVENDNEHTLEGDETIHELDEDQLKQEFVDNEANEMGNDQENPHSEKKEEHENNLAAAGSEKKWPGWPGESVFRMLVPAQKVGNIIGRKGEYIKKIVEETKARIKILDGPPGSQERAVSF